MEEEQLQKQEEELEIIQKKQEEHRQEYEELRREKLDKGIRRGTIYGRRPQAPEDADIDGSASELSMVLKGKLCSLTSIKYSSITKKKTSVKSL